MKVDNNNVQPAFKVVPEPKRIADHEAERASHLGDPSKVEEMRFKASLVRFKMDLATFTKNAPHQTSAQTQKQEPPADMDKVKDFFDRIPWANNLAKLLQRDPPLLNAAEKMQLVAMAIRSDRAANVLTIFMHESPPNFTYDDQKQLAKTIGQAYQAGLISDADLRQLAARLGPEQSAQLAMILAQAPENLKAGGVVEAYGKQAQSLNQEQAAALAFSSSEELIQRNLTTTGERQAAFEQVKDFLSTDHTGRVTEARYEASPALQSEYVQALGNAARLVPGSGPKSAAEFEAILKQAGPRFAQEAVARCSHIEGDDKAQGALNVMGDTSRRLADKTQGDDDKRKDWRVSEVLAYTQSEALINDNLPKAHERQWAFDLLNHKLADARDDFRDAAKDGYSLLRAPAMMEGMVNLLTLHPDEILGANLTTKGNQPNYQGQAELVNFFQSTLFSPYTDKGMREQIQSAIEKYAAKEVSYAGDKGSLAGNSIGRLFGVLQAAQQESIKDAKKPEEKSFIEKAAGDLAKTVIKASAGALLAPTGPVAALAGGFILDQVLNKIFDGNPPSPDKLGEAFIAKLEAAGQNVNLGEDLMSKYNGLLTEIEAKLSEVAGEAVRHGQTQEYIKADYAHDKTQDLLESLRYGFHEVINSDSTEGNGLSEALKDWD